MVTARILLIVTFCISIIFAQCDTTNATLKCLKSNFEEGYSKNYDLFWKILRQAGDAALTNRQETEIAAFLDVASSIKGNSEVGEYFSEVAESLLVAVPDSFIAATAKLSDRSDIDYVVTVLKGPTYHSPEQIQAILENQRIKEKKKLKFLDEYFKSNTNKVKK
jgi:hypothetical protein